MPGSPNVGWVPKAKRIEQPEADVVYNTMITDATDFFCLKGFSEVEIEWACCCMKH